jgi:hypothetical protein
MDALVGLARTGPFNPDLWKAQTTYFDFLKSIASGNDLIVNDSWLQHFRSLGKRLGIAVEQLLHDVAVVENPVAIGPGGELTPVQTA